MEKRGAGRQHTFPRHTQQDHAKRKERQQNCTHPAPFAIWLASPKVKQIQSQTTFFSASPAVVCAWGTHVGGIELLSLSVPERPWSLKLSTNMGTTYQVISALGEIQEEERCATQRDSSSREDGGWFICPCASGLSSIPSAPSAVTQTHVQAEAQPCWADIVFQPAELAEHEEKLLNINRGLEDVSCSERFMEFTLLNAAEVKKQLIHGSIKASPNSRELTLDDFLI